MGATVKVVAVYTKPFWRDQGLNGAAVCRGRGGRLPLSEIHDMSGPDGKPGMLLGFGQGASRWDDGGEERPPPLTEERVIEQLVELYGPEANAPVRVIIKDWSREDYTSPPGVHTLTDYDHFGSPALQAPAWDGTLFWASTETSAIAGGHIEGALAAAERTVEAIRQRLQPQPPP